MTKAARSERRWEDSWDAFAGGLLGMMTFIKTPAGGAYEVNDLRFSRCAI